jgi:mRNA (2'-O-methyladenosine-N6-)-methyltransferase
VVQYRKYNNNIQIIMSDTWNELQSFRSKQSSLREKLAKRRKERQGVGGAGSAAGTGDASRSLSPTPSSSQTTAAASPAPVQVSAELLNSVEKSLLAILDDATIDYPCSETRLRELVTKDIKQDFPENVIGDLLEKYNAQAFIAVSKATEEKDGTFIVESVEHKKLSAFAKDILDAYKNESGGRKRKADDKEDPSITKALAKHPKREDLKKGDDVVESLLSSVTAKELDNKLVNDEILQLLSASTAKEQSIVEKFKSQGGASVKEFCPYGTKDDCRKMNGENVVCEKLHFKKIIHKHTDESLGDCSFLNTCFHIDVCKYVHYEIEYPEVKVNLNLRVGDRGKQEGATVLVPPQWVQCDLRTFDMSVLGKFTVVMADPPWDIHMELPYGTMSDDEMRKLPVPVLQDDGYIFLWVTGRAMELGRECLKFWGYERIDELIWVKTNQLQRIIRTGRTGHWLNHGKEHCLVGVKGNLKNANRGLDCDVIVAEVRATSHKPDEIYGIIERLSPGTRKIELFGRPHNIQPNWVTLGNQTDGVKLLDPDVVASFKARYPEPKMAIMPLDKQKEMLEEFKRREQLGR